MTTIRSKSSVKKAFNGFIINIRSRHPSHKAFRSLLPRLPFRTIVRLGSTTELEDGKKRIECNSVEAIKNSSNKLLMKKCFTDNNVKSADWCNGSSIDIQTLSPSGFQTTTDSNGCQGLRFPIVAKSHFGSRGNGNYLLKTIEEFNAWEVGKTLSEYIFEKFYNYSREYRLHVTAEGCFYTCRKMLKSDTPEANRWYRNDSNCNWFVETNTSFNKPSNWREIESECVKALKACKLDIGACDVKVSAENNSKFIVIEINSAPSFGEGTQTKYLYQIPRILLKKFSVENPDKCVKI